MSKRRLLLHIGAPKTGTTSLQSILLKHQQAIRKQGINPLFLNTAASQEFAELFGSFEANHFTRAQHLHSLHQAIKYYLPFVFKLNAKLFYNARRYNTTVISSEHLFLRLTSQREINHFVQFMQRFFTHIEVVIYHRSVDSLKKSLYWEYLKVGGRAKFDRFTEKNHKPQHDCDWAVNAWGNAVGQHAVMVRQYEQTPDVVDDFLTQVLGLPPNAFYTPAAPGKKRENTSPSFDKFEELRQYNLAHRDVAADGTMCQQARQARRDFVKTL